ncbi:hypothetical protein ACPWUU_14160, partial [Bordetella pertussis]|uniref:hypothetical protein n=1 Tax=Bordetella pertussis TaxID=520 RepID=UPI003CEF0183
GCGIAQAGAAVSQLSGNRVTANGYRRRDNGRAQQPGAPHENSQQKKTSKKKAASMSGFFLAGLVAGLAC